MGCKTLRRTRSHEMSVAMDTTVAVVAWTWLVASLVVSEDRAG